MPYPPRLVSPGVSPVTPGACWAAIRGDAAAVNPPLIPCNPELRPPNRGGRTGRRLERSPQRAWATPLHALLGAERAALLTGRDEDFIMIVTMA